MEKYCFPFNVNLPNWNDRSILNLGNCSSIKENYDITQYPFLFQDATAEDDVEFEEEEELVEETE
jgi:hypothetical protein